MRSAAHLASALVTILLLSSCRRQVLLVSGDSTWTYAKTSALADPPSITVRVHNLHGRNLGSRKVFVQEVDAATKKVDMAAASLVAQASVARDANGNAFIVTNSQGRATITFPGPVKQTGADAPAIGAHHFKFTFGKRNLKSVKKGPSCLVQVELLPTDSADRAKIHSMTRER